MDTSLLMEDVEEASFFLDFNKLKLGGPRRYQEKIAALTRYVARATKTINKT